MTLPNAGWPDKQDRLVLFDEVAARECLDELRVERWLKREVELFECLEHGETCRAQTLFDAVIK
jgi:hypothetical protein